MDGALTKMEIQTDDYRIWYEPATATLTFQGLMRELGLSEYKPLEQLLVAVIDQQPPIISMNLQKLEFLNSTGMTILSRFVIEVRKKKNIKLLVQASNQINWQNKSLANWQRLMPTLVLNLE